MATFSLRPHAMQQRSLHVKETRGDETKPVEVDGAELDYGVHL